ncbi:unnamed protein product [Arctogadus glacialis]
MSFTGKYQLESQENFESFMKAIGLPDELIQKGKDIKSLSEIEENGDNFKVTVTTGTKVLVNTFIVGQEADLETVTGEKIKSKTLRGHGRPALSLSSLMGKATEAGHLNAVPSPALVWPLYRGSFSGRDLKKVH